jgi:hypothetical protein
MAQLDWMTEKIEEMTAGTGSGLSMPHLNLSG